MWANLLIFGLLLVICFESYLLVGFMSNAHTWMNLNEKLLEINTKLQSTLKAAYRLNCGTVEPKREGE